MPANSKHAKLRIRRSGDSYTITKKSLISEETASEQVEENISINKEEFDAFRNIEGNKIEKIRYYYKYLDRCVEFDVFCGKLRGLVLVDIEFESSDDMKKFIMPDFCLADVSEEELIAGGVLSRQSFKSLSDFFKKYNYKKIIL